MKRKIALLLTSIMVLTGTAGMSLTTHAEEQKTYPMYDPQVFASDGYVYGPSIQVNQYSGCIWGCSVLSSRDQLIKDMGGFTDVELNLGAEPVLYVADHYGQTEERKLIESTISQFGGNVVCALDMQLFKYTGTWYEPYSEVKNPLEIIIGIPDEANHTKLWANADKWEFAMARLHDGKVEILKDMDDDSHTLRFTTDKFSIYAIIYAPIGNIDAYLAQQTGQTTTSSGTNDDLDEVPKMGDDAWEGYITYGLGRRR